MAALAGLVIERTVIRFLYRRPLESLLATWGVSLVMQQLFRMVFGANNVQVNSPSWLLGHFSRQRRDLRLQPRVCHRFCHRHRRRHLAVADKNAARAC